MKRSSVILVLLFGLASPVPRPAWSQVSASVEGVVSDSTGAVLPGAAVTVTNIDTGLARETTTDDSGRFSIFGLTPGERYEIRVLLSGFQEMRRALRSITAGERRNVDFVLPLGEVSERVDVVAEETALIKTVTPAISDTLKQEQVETLPVKDRRLIDLAYLMPGAAPARGFYNLAPRLTINGSSSLTTNYTVDGFDNTDLFLGGPKVPMTIGSTQNLSVLVNSYSSEYGRTGNGVFAVTTRSGSRDWTGDLFYYVRPGSVLDSPNYFAPRDENGHVIDDNFQRHQVGGSVGGAFSERTFFFANTEITRQTEDAILTSPLAEGLAPTGFHDNSLMAKVDHEWTTTQSSTLRYLFDDNTHDKDVGFIGGLTLPSAGLEVNANNHFVAWNHRSLFGESLNELGIQIGRMKQDWRTPDPGPRAIVTDRGATLAVVGGVSDNFFWTESDFQIRNVYTRLLGPHTLKIGGDILHARFDIRSGPGARGAYTVDLEGRTITPSGAFLTLDDIPRDVTVLSYSQTFLNPGVKETQDLLAFFAEATLAVDPRLNLSLGLRWEYDSVTNTPVGDPDLNNFGPRLGLTWTPHRDGRGWIRAGYGIFHERIPFAVYSDTIFNNPDGGAIAVTFAPGTAFPPPEFPSTFPRDAYLNVPLDQLPPRNVQVFDPNLVSPRAQQISIGYSREITADFALAFDYVNHRGYNLIRRVDTNPPATIPSGTTRTVAEADATRPIPPAAGGFRLIEQDESTGRSVFNGLYITAKKRFSHRFSFDVSYTLSKTENDTDDINFRPVDSRRPNDEFGPSLNDRRHVLAVNGYVRVPFELDLLPIFFASSGQPLNPLTGRDDNGDTLFNDRVPGLGRNSERTTGFKQLDLGVRRVFRLFRYGLEVRADIFNLFNWTNFSGFFNFGASGVRPDETGTLAFQPTVAGPPRQFQFAVRFTY